MGMERTIFALFDNYDHAEMARKELLNSGVSGSDIDISRHEAGAARTEPAEGGGFMARLRHLFMGEDRTYYEEATRRGGAVLTVSTDESRLDRVVDILQKHHPVDLDRRVEEWRAAGWEGGPLETPGSRLGAEGTAGTRRTRGQGDETIPVVEEKLTVGKHREVRGGVRIYSRVTETPVQEDVTLREERVDVERRPASRPAGSGELRERTVEMTETREEPVVRKEARVVEEIILRKDVKERKETVRDKVRKTEVEVERLDNEFRKDFETRYAGRGYAYEHSRAAYNYGRELALDPRFRGKNWEETEPEARRMFEERNPGMWGEHKGAVRLAFERTQGRKAA
jgi:stress response protein YsnF